MLRIVALLILIAGGGYGAWWLGKEHPEIATKALDLIGGGSIHTLEVRYTAAQVMEAHRKELLKSGRHQFLEPELKFYPYLLLEVKYNLSDEQTREGLILWDLTDGEMVLSTKKWEKTHGFGDCLSANVDRQEFKFLSALAKRGGSLDREGLCKNLHLENELLDSLVDSLRRKKLIVQTGNRYRLHLQNPNLRTLPETKVEERLVTKSEREAERQPRRFSASQIERLTKAAFGSDFSIRKTVDVYLPVHSISVQNPDGSIHTSHWNALNGQPLPQSCLVE